MHSRQFLSYHPADRFDDHSLLFYDRHRLQAVLPAASTSESDNLCLRSHPGASYGGLVFGRDVSYWATNSTVTALVRYARANGFARIWMRTPEPVFFGRHCAEIDAALFQAGFRVTGRELSSAVSLRGVTEDTVIDQFRDNARGATKRALSLGVVARNTNAFGDYWKLLAGNLNRHDATPTHSLAEIQLLREVSPDRIFLVGGYLNDKLVSGALLFQLNATAGHTFYMAQDSNHRQLRSLNLVVHQALVECVRRKLQWLNFGISSIPGSGGHEMNEGLLAFKRSCGGQGVMRDLWELVL